MTGVELAVVIIGSGGLAGAVVALIKVRPEATRITVDAAEGAVVVQTGVITDLRNENERLNDLIEDERKECDRKLAIQDRKIAELELAFTKIDQRRKARPAHGSDVDNGGMHE